MWYYSRGSDQTGPIDYSELVHLIKQGSLSPDVWVWQPEFEDWKPISDIPELLNAFPRLPPPLPRVEGVTKGDEAPPKNDVSSEKKAVGSRLAGPWARFTARMIDIWIWQAIIGISIGIWALFYNHSLYEFISSENNSYGVGVILLPFVGAALIIQMAVFGTTIGKAIVGIRVETLYYDHPLKFHFNRELAVWVVGLAMGMPIINLFTMGRQASRVGDRKPATYDVERARVVSTSKRPNMRTGIGLFIWGGMVVLTVVPF